MSYKKYDPAVKKMIVETGNYKLFPELKIPRTTAQYWISKSKEVQSNVINLSAYKNFYVLKKEILELKTQKEFLQRMLKKVLETKPFLNLLGAEKKKYVIELIDEMKRLISVTQCVQLIGMKSWQYYRWRAEVYGCEISQRRCESTKPNQLSRSEQIKLVELAKDRKLSHMSIKSLMYYAQREGLLYCGYDSWLKYIKINNVKRYRQKRVKKKLYRIGIRAKKPNEIWHIDITEIKIANEEKYYLQMIIDNFSRSIMSWKLSCNKNLQLTVNTINRSIRSGNLPEYMMSDNGRENVNNQVIKILWGKGICQMIALTDVQFSNSMIEAVFRKLKGAINFNRVKTYKGLHRKISWFVKENNFNVPHSKLNGAIPNELLNKNFDKLIFQDDIFKKRIQLIKSRSADYKKCLRCGVERS